MTLLQEIHITNLLMKRMLHEYFLKDPVDQVRRLLQMSETLRIHVRAYRTDKETKPSLHRSFRMFVQGILIRHKMVSYRVLLSEYYANTGLTTPK